MGDNTSYSGDGIIEDCNNSGDVIATGTLVGGIVGEYRSPLQNCSNTGDVSGATNVGGVVGNIHYDLPPGSYAWERYGNHGAELLLP